MTIDFTTFESMSLRLVLGTEKGLYEVQLGDGSDTLGTISYKDEVWQFKPNTTADRFFFSFELIEISDFMNMLEAFQFVISKQDDDKMDLLDIMGVN